jgi:photosynthetic reaction center cytochrome c subunit
VKVLGNLSVNEITRLMLSMTSWVAPTEGCAYCHNPANFAEDVKYTKVVARRMIEMTRHINADWKVHVAETGVTCYTCHRGNPVPNNIWHKEQEQAKGADFIGDRAGQNLAANSVVGTSLPSDPFTPFLLGDLDIRVNGTTALPNGNRHSIKQAEWTYGLMTHMSSALGVNCTYCHNTQSFSNWNGNPPQRSTAWYGIRMARDLNKDYMEPLASVFPEHRLGPTGDAPKANCATCHQGAYKPLYGQSMLKDHPQLAGPGTGLDKTTLAKK